MNGTLSNTINNVWERAERESQVKTQLLVIMMSKPFETLSEFPKWNDCAHVDFRHNVADSISATVLEPAINNLVGLIAHRGHRPVDFCIVRADGKIAFVVKVKP